MIKFGQAVELHDAQFFTLVEQTNEESSLALPLQKTQLSLFFTILLEIFGESYLSLLHGQSDVPILGITLNATLSIIPFPGTFDADILKKFLEKGDTLFFAQIFEKLQFCLILFFEFSLFDDFLIREKLLIAGILSN